MATLPPPSAETKYVDFGRAFRFFFEDPNWVRKILLGSLFQFLALLLVGWPFLLGYAVQVLRRSARGEQMPLPEWDDYGQLFMEGLPVLALYLLHVLAILALPVVIGCVFGVLGAVAKGDTGSGIAGIGIFLAEMLVFVIMVPVMVYFPSALIRMAVLGRFNAGLEIRENIELIKRSPGNYFTAFAISFVANLIAGVLFYCCIPYLPAAFWALCVGFWAFGEVARRDPVLGGNQTGYAQVFA